MCMYILFAMLHEAVNTEHDSILFEMDETCYSREN